MDDDDTDLMPLGPKPKPREMAWGPVSFQRPARPVSVPHQLSAPVDATRPFLVEQLAEVVADEVIDHALVEPVVGAMIGEPVASALSLAMLLTSLVDLTKGAARLRPTAKTPERVLGPGSERVVPRCCREAASRYEACSMHPAPTMGW